MSKKKVVLAYSGGLDTSIMIPWLKENYDCEVIAMCANLGQADELTGLEEKAIQTGASKVYIEDLRQEFITDYIYPTLRSGAKFEREYLLGTSFGRPLIAKRQVEIAEQEGATLVAHGATGKGNDQVRFELTYMALNPSLQIIAPWKDPKWNLHSREACIDYAESRNIPISQSKKRIYSEDRNIWHISHEGGSLENPGNEPDADVFTLSKTLESAPDRSEYVEIEFEQGTPVSVNGKRLNAVQLVETLNKIGSENAIGQLDMVENRLIGIKSRGIYETPGGTILYAALRQIEQLVLDRDTLREKDKLAITYADLVYDGRWFTPLRESLDAFYNSVHANSTGKARLKLYKGNVVPAGTWADKSLYLEDLASFTDTPLFDQKDSTGFLRIYGLPLKVRGLVYRGVTHV
jgi:argininosuccinate synthase